MQGSARQWFEQQSQDVVAAKRIGSTTTQMALIEFKSAEAVSSLLRQRASFTPGGARDQQTRDRFVKQFVAAIRKSARELGKRKENEDKPVVDRFAQLRVKPRLTFAATGALTVAATALQVVKPAVSMAAAATSAVSKSSNACMPHRRVVSKPRPTMARPVDVATCAPNAGWGPARGASPRAPRWSPARGQG